MLTFDKDDERRLTLCALFKHDADDDDDGDDEKDDDDDDDEVARGIHEIRDDSHQPSPGLRLPASYNSFFFLLVNKVMTEPLARRKGPEIHFIKNCFYDNQKMNFFFLSIKTTNLSKILSPTTKCSNLVNCVISRLIFGGFPQTWITTTPKTYDNSS